LSVINGEIGFEQTATSAFDMTILELTLLEMQVIDVLTLLKNSESTKDIPVLMITGSNNLGLVEDAFRKSANVYLAKPFEIG
jgi:CheY-like chemotaxis protein